MQKNPHFNHRRMTVGIGSSLLLSIVMVAIIIKVVFAGPLAANLDSSTKVVSDAQAFPGQALQYTVVIQNSGDTAVPNAAMTDTLPVGLTYQPGTLTYTLDSAVTTSFGESGGEIKWTGVVSELGSVVVKYTAILNENLTAGTAIVNDAIITGTGSLITRAATTTVITTTEVFFPVLFRPVPTPFLESIPETTSSNQWTVSWLDVNMSGVSYELQEASSAGFSNPTTIDAGTNLSQVINHTASFSNLYCYRVRAKANGLFSAWSNVRCTYGNYADGFSSSSSGWAIRRQDTDDTANSTSYVNDTFKVKIGGRWDYAIAAPMVPAPASSYRIDTMVRLSDGIDNLHTYGIVFGGDWNGQPCPNNDYSSCFNHYYRLQVIWYGNLSRLRMDLKRIDYHDSDNVGRGDHKVLEFKDVRVDDASGWNKWTIERFSNGLINVYVNDNLVGSGVDPTYIDDRYYGVYAASNEYSGTAAVYDWFNVTALP